MKGIGARIERGDAMSEIGAKREDAAMDDSLMDFTLDELREFLEADLVDVRADPEFKERLRRRLWDLVLARSGQRRQGGKS
ncbi:MAG: hypothetical protein OEM05_12755 [Myxococcales bacterium]|nr:hypothetical protein [Myxococcales bacterium]